MNKNACVNKTQLDKFWSKWQAANLSCPLQNTKELREEKLIPSGLWKMQCEGNNKSMKLNCCGFPMEPSIRTRSYQSKYYRGCYLTTAKTSIQKEVKILTFDVHELHISQCWLPELTYR